MVDTRLDSMAAGAVLASEVVRTRINVEPELVGGDIKRLREDYYDTHNGEELFASNRDYATTGQELSASAIGTMYSLGPLYAKLQVTLLLFYVLRVLFTYISMYKDFVRQSWCLFEFHDSQ
jgi:hypothetical protein